MRFLLKLCVAGLCLLTPLMHSAAAAEKPSKEYLVKAAFLYNFTKFVEWPVETSQLTICLLGADKFGIAADAIAKKSSTQQQYLIVRNPDANTFCHIAYFSTDSAPARQLALQELKTQPVLTVGEGEGFVREGGVLSFAVVDNKIKLVVNLNAARDSGLRVDSQLLEVAFKVLGR